MSATADAFNAGLADWKEWQEASWGRLYYTVVRANLQRHLGERPLHILDAGGGNGPDALYFAARGHRVTLLDFSTGMLADARRVAEARGLTTHLTFHHADCLAVPDLFPAQTFDVVLCHNVLQYVDDAGALLRALCVPLKPRGVLSVIGMNRYSEVYRAVFGQGDLITAYARLDARNEVTPVFGATMRLYTADEMAPALRSLGCEVVGHYGVRCVADYLPNDGRKDDPQFYADLARLECALATTHPYNLVARYFHLIGCRTAMHAGPQNL